MSNPGLIMILFSPVKWMV